MIRWTHPEWLVLGLGLVLVVGLMMWRYERRRRWALAAFAGELARDLAHAEPAGQRHVRWGLRVGALALLVIAAAGPRWGEEVVRVTSQGSDVVLAFDVSSSMDARDVPPTRLEEAKREALTLLDGLEGDRVAVVAFAGDAVALSPLTLDLSAVRLLVETLSSEVVATPGSDVGRGLKTALRVLPEGDSGEQALVLFTDGEDLEGGLAGAAAVVQQRGVKVLAVGVGTPAGETIPVLDAREHQVGVKTDANGQPVVSRLDAPALEGLARRTHGRYFAANHPGGEVGALKAALGGVNRGAREGRLGSRPVERFQWFALLAWLALVASWMLPERHPVSLRRPRGATRTVAIAGAVVLGLAWHPLSAHALNALVEGNRLYGKGDYRGAARVYQAALKPHPDDPALLTNLGAALYRAGDFTGAEQAFSRARPRDAAGQGLAAYGRGDALFRQQRLPEALSAFREALEKRPGDADARHNYELTLGMMHARPQPKPDEQPPPPQPKPPQPGPGGGGGGGSPPPAPPQGNSSPKGGQAPPSPGGSGANGQLARAEAERLLDALGAGERDARAAQRRRQAGEPRREKDW